MNGGRREFVMGSVASALVGALGAGCAHPPSREQVLQGLILDVMVPVHQELVETSQALVRAAVQVTYGGDLRPARLAFRDCLLTWMRAYSFREGPIVSSYALMRALYWPARPGALEALVASERPVDPRTVEALGVDRRGMFTLERLLFEPGPSALLTRHDASGATARALLGALSEGVARHAELAAKELGRGERLAASYAGGGQESIGKLVNQMIGSVEAIVMERFTAVAQMAELGRMRVAELRGGPSGLSTQIVKVEVAAVERLYDHGQGRGLRALVKQAAPKLESSLTARFRDARRALDVLALPLERAVTEQRALFDRALAAVRMLELALKTELASALGVTLMFVAGDGD